jgi:FkbM family methyltransferase
MSTTVHSKNDSDKNKVHSESGYLYLAKNEKPEKINVPAFTLEYLLDKCKAPPLIDFFSLDVEGNELEVLKGLSHIKYRFKYIVVETSDFENVSAFLSLKNYQYIRRLSVHDYLFKDLGV